MVASRDPAAAIAWAVVLVATGVGSGLAFAVGAALLAFIDVTLGVLVFQAARLVVHRLTRTRA
jgi:hypothetical protein